MSPRELEAAQSGESAIYFAVGGAIFCWLLLFILWLLIKGVNAEHYGKRALEYA